MRKSVSSLMIGVIVALTSCSKSGEAPNLPQTGDQLATFQIEVPAETRAAVTGLTRYILEAYEDKDLTTTPIRTEAATGSLTLVLKKNTDYTLVFWADKGTAKTENVASSGYYNTDNLQEVVVPAGKENTVGEAAYCLMVSFNSKDFEANKAIVLKNATAQINFIETVGLAAASNSLLVKYSSGGKLNVATGKVTDIGSEISRTYNNIGQITQNGIVASDYILAPLGEKRLLDLKMTFNSEPAKEITAVPFQQNYKTNIKGEYSNVNSFTFTVTVDDAWNTPDNDVEFQTLHAKGLDEEGVLYVSSQGNMQKVELVMPVGLTKSNYVSMNVTVTDEGGKSSRNLTRANPTDSIKKLVVAEVAYPFFNEVTGVVTTNPILYIQPISIDAITVGSTAAVTTTLVTKTYTTTYSFVVVAAAKAKYDYYYNGANRVGVVYRAKTKDQPGLFVSLDEATGKCEEATSWESSNTLPNGMKWHCPSKDELSAFYNVWSRNQELFNDKLTKVNGTVISKSNYWVNSLYDTLGLCIDFNDGNLVTYKGKDGKARAVSSF